MKTFAKSRNGKMLKIGEDPKSAKWYFLSDAVVKFAETGIAVGDEVTIKTEEDGGKYTITYITKGKDTTPTTETPIKEENPKYICEDCGKELKDDKYKKCYACNQKNPTPKTSNNFERSTSTNESIKRQAIMHAVSRTLIALQGHVDLENVEQVAERLYQKFRDLVG